MMQGPPTGRADSAREARVTPSLSDTVRFMRRLGVLASGSGTILQAILDADLPVTARSATAWRSGTGRSGSNSSTG
ncbi:MAG TPA: hypothetical protein VLL94_15165, partial [Nitrospiraceae bacterium]|nr:hypothetical protein [Nitrospiraceae bacterium]